MNPLDRLKDRSLFRTESYIGGRWETGDSRFRVHNPANRGELAEVHDVGAEGAKAAVAAAAEALKSWRKTSVFERGRILRRWYDLIVEHQHDLGVLITAEMGKPLPEAKGEVVYGAAFVDWSIEEAKRMHGETIAVPIPGSRGWTVRQPVGVVSCITPWNFPSAMVTRKCAPAMAAGCTIVLKPAPETPLSALALAELADRAGIPAGVFNVVCGDAEAIGPVLTGSPDVRLVGFTGSTEVGKLLMRQAADGIKRVALELGGNAPFLVMDDADIEEAANGIVRGKFRAAGQTCVSPNRIIVQEAVADDLIAALEAKVKAIKVGDGFEAGVEVGPLIHDEAVERVSGLVESARREGARVIVGGEARTDLGGSFFAPTLIEGGSFALDLACYEIFGPIASVYRAKDEAEMIAAANDTPYGLAAYLYTRDIGRVHRMSEGLDFGMIGINAPTVGAASTPFGGMKQSGIGREGGKWGVEEFTELKYVLLAGVE
ncbi:NAD-dependent succinate-semialdehyde dehydrogenase [Hyphobacterium sp. SN044]|uniref:NAD-dependent succinate-semialdehyde dehydrogenase n=1 Tax=Hyphobacterium sp. SN044 TaxID=2912575 RepID=UPI001F2AB09C|nr:NAD-dependent succinate-semialdehyde dehydrogenase [Hyphobacterium sp. SN044]MCF8879311.1 NAD-dependent succinate-semialdehyde dehydrogenase [Hyphobacterium sp. SN044]